MTNVMIQNKIRNLEAELALIKRSVYKEPDFDVDEKNWKKLKPDLKRIRAKLFKRVYG